MQENRLFRILYYLLDKGRATAPELAEQFEVSVRTIYRDIDALSGAGIPIYSTTGRNGGIQLLDGYMLDKSLFSDQEKRDILSCLQSLAVVRYPEADDVLKKLSATFQVGLTDWIDVDFSHWGSTAENENLQFRILRQAILERRQIYFEYFGSAGTMEEREVQPQKLHYKDKAWYLSGFCLLRQADRLFRLSRMKNLALTEIHFDYRPVKEFPLLQEIAPLTELELEFAPEAGYRLFDTLDDKAITPHEGGYLVKITLPENGWLYDFLMSFGDQVTIIRPPALRQTILERCEKALKHHRGV